jgi:hypothetical protein
MHGKASEVKRREAARSSPTAAHYTAWDGIPQASCNNGAANDGRLPKPAPETSSVNRQSGAPSK